MSKAVGADKYVCRTSKAIDTDDQNDQYVNFLVNLLLNILIDALLFIIYCGCLTIGFWYVSIFFGYLYFNYSLDVDRALICFVSFFVLATFMPRKRTLHTFVITLYVYSLLLPTLVWFAVGGATPLHLLVTAAAFFVLLFLHHIKIRRLVVIALPHSQVAVAITLFSFALGLWIVSINGLSMVNIHIYDVYKFRRGRLIVFQYSSITCGHSLRTRCFPLR